MCTDLKKSRKKLGAQTADSLFGLINLLESASTLQDVNVLQIYHLHKLVGNRQHQYALDIDGRHNSYRLLVQPVNIDGEVVINKGEDLLQFYGNIRIIKIEEVSKHYA